jgi:anti-repressor protein
MAFVLKEIYDGLLKYNKRKAIIIFDENGEPWFSAIDIAKILEYSNTKLAIQRNVKQNQKSYFVYLKKYYHKDFKIHPHSVFINEAGLNRLILKSKKPIADKFFDWITE